jgi:tryptophanyl-tRNA synthetase
MLTEAARLPGLDGRKMSKSYGNAIYLKEDFDSVKKKIFSMLTDTNRKRLKDPGDPKNCNLFPHLTVLDPEADYSEVIDGCKNATRGCIDCKKLLFEKMVKLLEPIQQKRKELEKDGSILDILQQGIKNARVQAQKTMEEVRQRINLVY